MRQVLGAGALGWPRGMGWGRRWEGGSGWGTQVNPWLIHVSVWQKPLQYCKVISLQLIKINEKKNNKQGDNIQPWHTPFPIWNQSVVPSPVLTVASWPAYRFLSILYQMLNYFYLLSFGLSSFLLSFPQPQTYNFSFFRFSSWLESWQIKVI